MGAMRRAIIDYDMIQEGDRIAVGVSGGKDSLATLAGLAGLRRFLGVNFSVVAVTLDPQFGGEPNDFSAIEEFCRERDIEYVLRRTNIGTIIFDDRKEANPCSLCARMRRGYLYSRAQELGCNKIALGHHFNDVVETTLISMFYGSQLQAMLPKLHSTNFEGMTLIRPLYCVHEDDIIAWARDNSLEFIQCACRLTERSAADTGDVNVSKRKEIKLLLRRLRQGNPNIEKSIFNSIHVVALDTMPGFKTGGVEHSFLERFNAMQSADDE